MVEVPHVEGCNNTLLIGVVYLPERTEKCLITGSDQTGGPYIAALAGFTHLKESVFHPVRKLWPDYCRSPAGH